MCASHLLIKYTKKANNNNCNINWNLLNDVRIVTDVCFLFLLQIIYETEGDKSCNLLDNLTYVMTIRKENNINVIANCFLINI